MKRFLLSLCFVAFAGAGLVSCADEAAEITPQHVQDLNEPQFATDGAGTVKEEIKRPGSN